MRALRQGGFSFPELLVAVLIVGILAAVTIPTFLGSRSRASDRAAQANLRSALAAVLSESAVCWAVRAERMQLRYERGTLECRAAAIDPDTVRGTSFEGASEMGTQHRARSAARGGQGRGCTGSRLPRRTCLRSRSSVSPESFGPG